MLAPLTNASLKSAAKLLHAVCRLSLILSSSLVTRCLEVLDCKFYHSENHMVIRMVKLTRSNKRISRVELTTDLTV